MNTCPVSVVIPTYNSASVVVQAVSSALAQTCRPAEVIVVDDGSTDDTEARLQRYAGPVRYVRQANQGVSATRNHGVRLARQEFVAFLDADDVWHPRKMEVQMSVFAARPDVGMVGAQQFDWPAAEFPTVDTSRPPLLTPVGWCELVIKNDLPTSAIVVRRAVADRAGPFDPSMQGPEDRDFWMRVADISTVVRVELPLIGYRDAPGSVSKQAARCQAGLLRILRKQDEAARWQGRWLLRRKAFSYVHHTVAGIHNTNGSHAQAIAASLRSFLWYPLPYRRAEVTTSAERLRRLSVSALRLLRLKAGQRPPGQTDDVAPDASQQFRAGLVATTVE